MANYPKKAKAVRDELCNIAGTTDSEDPRKINVVSSTIKWCFITAFILSIICVIINIPNHVDNSAIETVKDVWSIFSPIITLSMGYMFGKV